MLYSCWEVKNGGDFLNAGDDDVQAGTEWGFSQVAAEHVEHDADLSWLDLDDARAQNENTAATITPITVRIAPDRAGSLLRRRPARS